MAKRGLTLDTPTALSYVGQTVLLELRWEGDTESFWQCADIVGVLIPRDSMQGAPCFLAVEVSSSTGNPHGSGNVLGRMTLTHSADGSGSGAALPARRNSSTVPANGSTGAAHP